MSPRFRDTQSEARSYALRLLGYRSRSRKELRSRLNRRGFSHNHIDSTIEHLEKTGLLDDDAVAREIFRYAVERKFLGKKGIERLLTARGIGKGLVNESLSAMTREAEEETAVRLTSKKIKTLKDYPDNVIRRRLWGMLQRRGFSRDIIRSAIISITDKRIR
jgi:regulatory protein